MVEITWLRLAETYHTDMAKSYRLEPGNMTDMEMVGGWSLTTVHTDTSQSSDHATTLP